MYSKYPWVVLWVLLSFVLVTIYHVKTTKAQTMSGADSMRLPRFGRFVSWWSCDFARGDKWKGWLQETFIVHHKHRKWHGKIRPPKKDWQVALVPWWFFKGFSHFFKGCFQVSMANPVTCGIICGPVEGSFIETNNPQVGMGHCLGGSNLMLEIFFFVWGISRQESCKWRLGWCHMMTQKLHPWSQDQTQDESRFQILSTEV